MGDLDDPIVISEKRGVTITVGLMIHFIITILLILGAYVSIRSDVSSAIDQGKRNDIQLQVTRDILDRTRLDVNGVGVKLDEFMQTYDRDMNRYIREGKDRR